MAISNKDRKKLWAKSGNRCAICKTELFAKKQNTPEFNIGDECHIISSKELGPRHKKIANYDSESNLILLCRNHHKEIDSLVDTYTEEILRYIKQNHENWVNSSLKLETNKIEKPRFLSRISSGKELLEILSALGCRTDYDEITSEEEAEFVGGIAQTFVDYLDIISDAEPYERVKISLSLNRLLGELEEKGYFLFGEKKLEHWRSDGTKDQLEVATLVIKKIDSEDIIKVDLSSAST